MRKQFKFGTIMSLLLYQNILFANYIMKEHYVNKFNLIIMNINFIKITNIYKYNTQYSISIRYN